MWSMGCGQGGTAEWSIETEAKSVQPSRPQAKPSYHLYVDFRSDKPHIMVVTALMHCSYAMSDIQVKYGEIVWPLYVLTNMDWLEGLTMLSTLFTPAGISFDLTLSHHTKCMYIITSK